MSWIKKRARKSARTGEKKVEGREPPFAAPRLVAKAPAPRPAEAFPRFQSTASDELAPGNRDRFAAARLKLRRAYTPAQPVNDRWLFAGRRSLLGAMIRAIEDERVHTIAYGRRGIGKFILGSVAEEILRHAPCPVLTVGPNVAVLGPRARKFRKILFATDFSESANTTFAFAVGLAQEQQAHLTLLHVIDKPRTGDLVQPHEIEQFALDHLASFVSGEAGLVSEPRTIVIHGAPGEKILEVAEREQADLIVLGLRESKGYLRATHLPGAVAHQVISQATCPVLTVRA